MEQKTTYFLESYGRTVLKTSDLITAVQECTKYQDSNTPVEMYKQTISKIDVL